MTTPIKTTLKSLGETEGVPAPPNPIMGLYEESYKGAGDWYAVSGGKPLPNWVGLDPNAYKTTVNPRRYRPIAAHLAQKAYSKRVEGLDHKFNEGDNLNDFRSDIESHLTKHGLDTIAYLPGLSDMNKMFNIVSDYPRFVSNYNKAIDIAEDTRKKYDEFDKKNSEAAVEFLENSLEITLKRRLDLLKEQNDSFACVWIRLMNLLANVSSDHYDAIREKVRKCTPSKYDRENITKMVTDITQDIAELECANQYEPSLTLSMLQNISNTCTQGGIFAHMLFGKISEVKKRVAECNFMSKQEANDHMKKHKVDPKSVLKELEEEYVAQLKDKLWMPAHLPQDRTKPSLNVMSCPEAGTDVNQLANHVLALLKNNLSLKSKSVGKKTRENSPCTICGEMGHWAPECPKRTNASDQQNGSKGKVKGKGTQAWRRVPPEPNQSETKLHNRKEYFWCAKCKRWTPSHSTATHRGSKGNATASSTQELAANLVLDPSVWFLSSEPEVSSGFDVAEPFHHQGVDFWFLIGYLALVFYFMPLSNAGRMSSLLGLWQSMKPFGSIVLRYVMSLGYPLLCTSSSYLLRLLELFSSVPLSCYCAPFL